jgi:hypothetical protein
MGHAMSILSQYSLSFFQNKHGINTFSIAWLRYIKITKSISMGLKVRVTQDTGFFSYINKKIYIYFFFFYISLPLHRKQRLKKYYWSTVPPIRLVNISVSVSVFFFFSISIAVCNESRNVYKHVYGKRKFQKHYKTNKHMTFSISKSICLKSHTSSLKIILLLCCISTWSRLFFTCLSLSLPQFSYKIFSACYIEK